MPSPGKVRPIQKFAEAVSKCGPEVSKKKDRVTFHLLMAMLQSSAYGQCILQDYQNITKDKCVEEFMRLKDCYLVSSCWLRCGRPHTDRSAESGKEGPMINLHHKHRESLNLQVRLLTTGGY